MTDFPPPGGGVPPPPPGNIPPPPQPPPGGWGAPPPPGPGGYHSGAYHWPESSQATTAMVLGIVSLAGGLLCGFLIVLAPVAWFLGQQDLTAIDAGRRDPTKRSQANAGRIMGIIGTVLLILGIIAIAVVIAIAAGSSSTS